MKLKTWLIISYFVVMCLPLVAGYGLFLWVSQYDEQRSVTDYVQKTNDMHKLEQKIDRPAFFQSETARKQLDKWTNEQLALVLYSPDGLMLYNSLPETLTIRSIGKEQLYKDLYDLQVGYKTYTLKKPVFQDSELLGFYEITALRTDWDQGVKQRSALTLVVWLAVFIATYGVVVSLLNRKLNRPLKQLMENMSAFAKGKKSKKLPQRNDEIGELTTRFETMKQQIERAQREIAQQQREKEYMVATISHDLKTPLTSIRAYSEALSAERALTAQEKQEYQSVIFDKIDYMHSMLDDLTTYTLLQSPTYEMALVEVDGSEFFEMLLSGYEEMCQAKHIQLAVTNEVTAACRVNAKQLIRVVDNLMHNAIRHTPEEGQIWLAAIDASFGLPAWILPALRPHIVWPASGIVLLVQNEGPGLNEEQLQRVFQPLYQTDDARSRRGDTGTGLGLSIAKRIMEKHDGSIRLSSAPESGTCVVCTFPEYH
ncbi:HAMP domain-containing sensor histidine kinase [Numidum massiliense]|uniref:HAMP domain-containing sensor histidine kinase n=1 Tax=Numidum massiliense TaxID=1522315 RepID=UPI0006D548DB|nr:HAMP domain-containing sensor histidine kinase [Numidum massiliense]